MTNPTESNPLAAIFDAPRPRTAAFRNATTRINELLDNEYARYAFRTILLHIDSDNANELTLRPLDDDQFDDDEREFAAELHECITAILNYEFSRDTITEYALSNSLCPMHFCDFAICFDDDDAECATIRMIYPHSHDT